MLRLRGDLAKALERVGAYAATPEVRTSTTLRWMVDGVHIHTHHARSSNLSS